MERTEYTARTQAGVKVTANPDDTVTIVFTVVNNDADGVKDIELTFANMVALRIASKLIQACGKNPS